jgi:hypothetical protein
MRALIPLVVVGVALVSAAQAATSLPASSDDPALMQIQARQDRWQGRQHFLYDEQHQPGADTVGASPLDARGCAEQPVRLKRSDGTTLVKRLKRCD